MAAIHLNKCQLILFTLKFDLLIISSEDDRFSPMAFGINYAVTQDGKPQESALPVGDCALAGESIAVSPVLLSILSLDVRCKFL